LAEALLLLLFMLLLALSARLNDLVLNKQTIEDKIGKLTIENKDLKQTNQALKRFVGREKDLAPTVLKEPRIVEVITDAAKINPSDPVSVLEKGVEYAKVLGTHMKPEDVVAPGPALAMCERERDQCLGQGKGGSPLDNDQPPIIALREADGFSFERGSADITETFRRRLAEDIVPKLKQLSERYGAQVVEVVGHTDGMPVGSQKKGISNLDDSLAVYFEPRANAGLFPYDNVGLGMARAASVTQALRAAGLASQFDIQPLSAAGLITPEDQMVPAEARKDDPTRRRIEIRIRRKSRADAPKP
jgi:outer membrane protein OmpA-like peptidoglycan-associated protein